MRARRTVLAALWLTLLMGCGQRPRTANVTGTVVIAAVGEPASVFPPLVRETVGRDIGDLIYERLADLAPGGAPADTTAYRPRLARAWERVDSLTWRFHLRPDAHWQDGVRLTAGDVRFSFEAFTDSTVDGPARGYLAGRLQVEVEDSITFLVRFTTPSPEQLYDAVYHVRIIPEHVWGREPPKSWAADTTLAHLIGSGSYRIRSWVRGQFITLAADPAAWRRARIGRLVWRFASDPDATLNLALSGEADLLEQIGPPSQQMRFRGDSAFELRPYPSALYGFLAFQIQNPAGRAHPVFGRRAVRRALAMAVDRPSVARALLGPDTRAPAGPMSRILWIGYDSIMTLGYDPSAAAEALDREGWIRDGRGVRFRQGRALRFDILVPTTSTVRKQAAVMLQETWRRLGAQVTITAVDFPVFEERIRRGTFDSYIGAYLDDPSPRGIADQFSRAGWEQINFGRYANPVFDSLLASAGREPGVPGARRLYREAIDTLNADAPAIFLYSPGNVAAIRHTVAGVTLDPYSWLGTLPEWAVTSGHEAQLGMH